jgi:hypothetical protein
MIRLHQYPPMFGIPNPSPFCMKLETWLRMTRLPFEVVRVVDPRKGPKGRVPWTALSMFLGETPHFFGEKPTELDAMAYGFLAQVLWAPGSRRVREHMQQTGNLPAFCERMKQSYHGGQES